MSSLCIHVILGRTIQVGLPRAASGGRWCDPSCGVSGVGDSKEEQPRCWHLAEWGCRRKGWEVLQTDFSRIRSRTAHHCIKQGKINYNATHANPPNLMRTTHNISLLAYGHRQRSTDQPPPWSFLEPQAQTPLCYQSGGRCTLSKSSNKLAWRASRCPPNGAPAEPAPTAPTIPWWTLPRMLQTDENERPLSIKAVVVEVG